MRRLRPRAAGFAGGAGRRRTTASVCLPLSRPEEPVRGSGKESWRIDERADGQGAPPVYDVYRGDRRVAWHLKDRAAAERWIARLGSSVPVSETLPARKAVFRPWWDEGG